MVSQCMGQEQVNLLRQKNHHGCQSDERSSPCVFQTPQITPSLDDPGLPQPSHLHQLAMTWRHFWMPQVPHQPTARAVLLHGLGSLASTEPWAPQAAGTSLMQDPHSVSLIWRLGRC